MPKILAKASVTEATPFLKWAGGKTQMLEQYAPYLPESFPVYHEPFFGGGALFYHLFAQKRFQRAYLSDINLDLVQTCWAVRDILPAVIELLEVHRAQHSLEHYKQVRGLRKRGVEVAETELSLAEKAARFIYLNKTCFNGLYRVNASGQFNVPIGSYKSPKIFDPHNLRLVSAAFAKAVIMHTSYLSVIERVQAGDFVYFDPPYLVDTGSKAFDKYTPNGFTFEDHQNLAALVGDLTCKGVKVMLSNSDYPFVRDLYSAFSIVEVKGKRSINSKGSGREAITELLVLNY